MKRSLLTIVVAIGLAGPIAHAQAPEGIRVRGQWTVDVRQPDGTLVEHREFDNALGPAGSELLARIISRDLVPGLWMVHFGGILPLCQNNEPRNPSNCQIFEPAGTIPGVRVNETLKVQFCAPFSTIEPCQGVPPDRLVITGEATAELKGAIGFVASALANCGKEISPLTCQANSAKNYVPFTRHWLLSPIDVEKGQIVQVKVVISFSSN